MGEIVNLRRARKRQANEAAEREADAYRLVHGLPKDERLRLKAERDAQVKRLEGHRLQPSGDGD